MDIQQFTERIEKRFVPPTFLSFQLDIHRYFNIMILIHTNKLIVLTRRMTGGSGPIHSDIVLPLPDFSASTHVFDEVV